MLVVSCAAVGDVGAAGGYGRFGVLSRLKNIGSIRLYRPDDTAVYGELGPVLTRPIRWELITQQHDQMVKYATALMVIPAVELGEQFLIHGERDGVLGEHDQVPGLVDQIRAHTPTSLSVTAMISRPAAASWCRNATSRSTGESWLPRS